MNASMMNTLLRRPMRAGGSMVSDRRVSIIAAVFGVLMVALLTSAACTMLRDGTRQDLGSYSPAAPAFDDQFDPLEIDLYTKPRSSGYALVDRRFDPLLP